MGLHNSANKRQKETRCYQIANFDAVYSADNDVLTKLEMRLISLGVFPAKIDFPSQMCCIEIIKADIDLVDIDRVFTELGLQAELVKD